RRLARLVQRWLAYDRHDRPGSAAELAAGLRACLSPVQRLRRWTRRRSRWVACAALAALSLGASGAYTLAQRAPYGERLYRQGLEAYQRKEYEKAIECFSQSLKPGSTQQKPEKLLFARGRAYQQLGDQLLEKALDCLDRNQQEMLLSDGTRQFSFAWN